MPKDPPPQQLLDALETAVEEYENTLIAAELSVARAEQDMIAFLSAVRSGDNPLTWRVLAPYFNVSHQALIERWGRKLTPNTPKAIKTRSALGKAVLPSEPTELNTTKEMQ